MFAINGWTKNKMIEFVKANFRGKSFQRTEKNTYTGELITKCLYRGPDGKKCAAGLFIPDHLYRESFEGASVGCLMARHSAIRDALPLDGHSMNQFQNCHDASEETQTLVKMLDWIEMNVDDEVTNV